MLNIDFKKWMRNPFLKDSFWAVFGNGMGNLLNDKATNSNMLHRMLRVNFICAIIPFGIAVLASPLITLFYGKTFIGMESTLIILLLATIPTTLANVYVANLLANDRKWTLSILRMSRDALSIISLYFVLLYTDGINASYNYAIINTIVAILFFMNTFIATKKLS